MRIVLQALAGCLLVVAGLSAWVFAFAGPDGAWWVYAIRYATGFAGLPLLVGALFTFYDGWDTPIR